MSKRDGQPQALDSGSTGIPRELDDLANRGEQDRKIWLERFLLRGSAYRMTRDATSWLVAKRLAAELEGGEHWSDRIIVGQQPGYLHWVLALNALLGGSMRLPEIEFDKRMLQADLHMMFRYFAGSRMQGHPYLRSQGEQLANSLRTIDFTETVLSILALSSNVLAIREEFDRRVVEDAESALKRSVEWMRRTAIRDEGVELSQGWSWFDSGDLPFDWRDDYWPIHVYFTATALRRMSQLYVDRQACEPINRCLIEIGLDYSAHYELLVGIIRYLDSVRMPGGGWVDFYSKGAKRSHRDLQKDVPDVAVTAEVLWALTTAHDRMQLPADEPLCDMVVSNIRAAKDFLMANLAGPALEQPELLSALTCELLLSHQPTIRYDSGGAVYAAFAGLMRALDFEKDPASFERLRLVAESLARASIIGNCWGGRGAGFRHFEPGGGAQSIAIFETARAVEAFIDFGIERDAGIGLRDIVREEMSRLADDIVLRLVDLYEPYERAGIRIAWGQIRSDGEDVRRSKGEPDEVPVAAAEPARQGPVPFVPDGAYLDDLRTCWSLVEQLDLNENRFRQLSSELLDGVKEEHRAHVRSFLTSVNQEKVQGLCRDLIEKSDPRELMDRLHHFMDNTGVCWIDKTRQDILFPPTRRFVEDWVSSDPETLAHGGKRIAKLRDSLKTLVSDYEERA